MFSPQMPLPQLVQLCRRLALSYSTGIDAKRTWQRESQSGTGKFRTGAAIVLQEVSRGQSLSEALLQPLFVGTLYAWALLGPLGYFFPESRADATRRTLRTMLTKPGWNHLEVRTMRGVLSAFEKGPRKPARKPPRA